MEKRIDDLSEKMADLEKELLSELMLIQGQFPEKVVGITPVSNGLIGVQRVDIRRKDSYGWRHAISRFFHLFLSTPESVVKVER